jgi:hypothetical protein
MSRTPILPIARGRVGNGEPGILPRLAYAPMVWQ